MSKSNDEMINPIVSNLNENLDWIKNEMGEAPDIIIRKFLIGRDHLTKAAIIYIDGLVNNSYITSFLRMLMSEFPEGKLSRTVYDTLKEQILNIGEISEFQDKKHIINEILTGSTAILIDKTNKVLIANTKGWEQRGVEAPQDQEVLRGPRQSFTENFRTNTALIRRIIPSSKLRLEQLKIGTITETTIGIMYVKGLADEKILNEVRHRLKRIKTDSILDSGYIGDFIQDSPFSLFPTTLYTERPDIVAGNLLEGRIAILVDGTPYILIIPVTLITFFQTADDYYIRPALSSLVRIMRIGAFLLSMTLPSLYVGITTFHPELLPITLLVSIAAQREGIPFPAFVEAVIMEFAFEILREAGLRMPKSIGQAVSIVGALVIGQAAVEAGIVSSVMVIIVALTAISSLTIPYLELSVPARIIRFFLLILSAVFGLVGILFGMMIVVIHLTALRSFGIPYLQGMAPFNLSDQKDIFIRLPWFLMKKRPTLFSQQNSIRQDTSIPKPPKPRQRRKKD